MWREVCLSLVCRSGGRIDPNPEIACEGAQGTFLGCFLNHPSNTDTHTATNTDRLGEGGCTYDVRHRRKKEFARIFGVERLLRNPLFINIS